MMYTYEQLTGKLRDDGGNVIGIGYSGAEPNGKNNPAMEHVVDVGPVPAGTYTIEGPPFMSKEHGPYCLRLVPDEETEARIISFGRDPQSFLMHGDSIPHPGSASEGCVIQDRMTREKVGSNLAVDSTLVVVSGIINSDTEETGNAVA